MNGKIPQHAKIHCIFLGRLLAIFATSSAAQGTASKQKTNAWIDYYRIGRKDHLASQLTKLRLDIVLSTTENMPRQLQVSFLGTYVFRKCFVI